VSRARTVQVGTGKRSRSTLAIKPLGELCEMDRRHVRPDDPDSKRLPFVGVEHIASGNGMIDLDSSSRVGNQKSTAYGFDKRHVLYGKLRPYLNKVATPDFSGKCSTELIPLLPRNDINRDFLAYLLRRQETVDFAMASVTGSRMPRTDMKTLLSMKVPAPPLDEQRQIVSILNRAARIEHLRAQAQELLREFIPALFVKMFGDPATNPMGWPKRRLEQLCIRTDQRNPGDQPEKIFRYVDISGIDSASKKIGAYRLISGSDAPSRARKEVRADDVLVSTVRPNLNAVAIVPKSLDGEIASTGFCILRTNRDIAEPVYLFLCATFGHFVDALVSKARGASYPSVTDRDIKGIQVPLPPLLQQKRFAELYRIAQNADTRATTGGSKTITLSSALMSRLLGGNA